MRLLHPRNRTYWMGSEERAELFLELEPPQTQETLDFYAKVLESWIAHEKDLFANRTKCEGGENRMKNLNQPWLKLDEGKQKLFKRIAQEWLEPKRRSIDVNDDCFDSLIW